jgi:hypothetical protein
VDLFVLNFASSVACRHRIDCDGGPSETSALLSPSTAVVVLVVFVFVFIPVVASQCSVDLGAFNYSSYA